LYNSDLLLPKRSPLHDGIEHGGHNSSSTRLTYNKGFTDETFTLLLATHTYIDKDSIEYRNSNDTFQYNNGSQRQEGHSHSFMGWKKRHVTVTAGL
jgi:hypothetical protein